MLHVLTLNFSFLTISSCYCFSHDLLNIPDGQLLNCKIMSVIIASMLGGSNTKVVMWLGKVFYRLTYPQEPSGFQDCYKTVYRNTAATNHKQLGNRDYDILLFPCNLLVL